MGQQAVGRSNQVGDSRVASRSWSVVVFKLLAVGHGLGFDVAANVVSVCENGLIRAARDSLHLRVVIVGINHGAVLRIRHLRQTSRRVVFVVDGTAIGGLNALHAMSGIALKVQPFARWSGNRQKVAEGITVHAVYVACGVREAGEDSDVLRKSIWKLGYVELPAVTSDERTSVALTDQACLTAPASHATVVAPYRCPPMVEADAAS